MFFVLQSIASGRSQSTKALETLVPVGSSEPTKALDLLPPLGPVRRSYSIWIYKPPLPDFGVLVAILIVISLAVRRAVAADFTSARLCFALWIADIGMLLEQTVNQVLYDMMDVVVVLLTRTHWRSCLVPKCVNKCVLDDVLRLHPILAIPPSSVDDTCTDNNWKWFKECLGVLDGTYIGVRVPSNQKPSHVLGDVVTRRNGLRVPSGKYYLCDCGYTNGPSFLTPYRGVRYHLSGWFRDGGGPMNYRELFNPRHTKARNAIERSFGILKLRWAILRNPAFYSIQIQNKMIMACCLIHNFIRFEMSSDPIEAQLTETNDQYDGADVLPNEYIDQVEPSPEWTTWRDNFSM
ncbi:hypothetical protein PHJA_002823300 [Phtheirospermum japonicum]|uniref:DDE Tnp4 domain-containing protein n=1 Tax=Phtheirospermum japonicum TaxID=374723 RepID=A0A830D812_9LAMI|nr:hypothetical protein PHJA_002823300 [Phtheirospermum japonicum]